MGKKLQEPNSVDVEDGVTRQSASLEDGGWIGK